MIEATLENPIVMYRDGTEWCAQYPLLTDAKNGSRLIIRRDYNKFEALNKMCQAVVEYKVDTLLTEKQNDN